MNIVGVDLSLTSTGIADADGARLIKTRMSGMARIEYIREKVLDFQRAGEINIFVIEGYSFGSHASHAHELGELGGVVRHCLFSLQLQYVDVPPSSLKRYATGKGNARKEDMLGAAIRRLGYEGNSYDEADALWLRAIGLDYYSQPVVSLPASHREALAKIDWPKVAVRA